MPGPLSFRIASRGILGASRAGPPALPTHLHLVLLACLRHIHSEVRYHDKAGNTGQDHVAIFLGENDHLDTVERGAFGYNLRTGLRIHKRLLTPIGIKSPDLLNTDQRPSGMGTWVPEGSDKLWSFHL